MNTEERERKTLQNVVKIYLIASIVAAIFYFTFLFNPNNISNPILYILLVCAELYIFIQSVGTWYTLLHVDENKYKNSKYSHLKRKIKESNEVEGDVGVFITVAGEEPSILEESIQHVKAMDVKHNVYVINDLKDLEDPRTKAYEALCKKYKVNYIKTVGNTQQKSGALNYALARTTEKYFVNFDVDFFPKKNFLLETLPYFYDEQLGWLQTPQVFRDTNNILARGSAEAVEAFYDFVMPGKNSFNAGLFVGTNAVFRREALESINGFQYHHSEDVFTGYTLHQANWKSLAIPDRLSYGLSPDDLASLFKQGLRWSGGSLEIFLHERVFTKKLTLDQKFQYFTTFSFYMYGVVILLMVIMPICYLLFGLKPLQSGGSGWALHYIPYFIFQFSTIALFASKLSPSAIIVSMNMFPVYIKGFINAIRRKHSKWTITNSAKGSGVSIFSNINLLYWHFILVGVSIIALIVGFINIREPATYLISAFWVSVNMVLTIVFIYLSLKASLKVQSK